MTNCLFSTIFFVLFLNLSFGSLRYSQVNRTFLSSFKGMYEASVVTINNSGEPIKPYFNQNIVMTYVTNYLEKNLQKYVTGYDLNVKFYYIDGGSECSTSTEKARCVKVSLNAKINSLFTYNNEKTYSIKEKQEL